MLQHTDTDYIHVDVMDGIFVKETTLSIDDVMRDMSASSKPLDIHLMVKEPNPYIDSFRYLNVENITIHSEIDNAKKIVERIKNEGVKSGIAINPNTQVASILDILPIVDYVLIMGVEPGRGGQKLIPSTIDKIDELRKLRKKNNYSYKISLDGGVNEETRKLMAGLDVIVSGSYVCCSDNFQERIDSLR